MSFSLSHCMTKSSNDNHTLIILTNFFVEFIKELLKLSKTVNVMEWSHPCPLCWVCHQGHHNAPNIVLVALLIILIG
jgi:hypothetical protein